MNGQHNIKFPNRKSNGFCKCVVAALLERVQNTENNNDNGNDLEERIYFLMYQI